MLYDDFSFLNSTAFLVAFPGAQMVKNPPAVQETGSVPKSGRSLGEGTGNPLQYSCLENPMDRGAWGTIVHVITKESGTTEQLALALFHFPFLLIEKVQS